MTVEMPDMESDKVAGRVNLLVNFGLRTGTMVALLATGLATVLFFTIAHTNVLGTTINFWYLACSSLVPLAMAGYGTLRDLRQRGQILSQVRLNFIGMMSFLVFVIFISLTAIRV